MDAPTLTPEQAGKLVHAARILLNAGQDGDFWYDYDLGVECLGKLLSSWGLLEQVDGGTWQTPTVEG